MKQYSWPLTALVASLALSGCQGSQVAQAVNACEADINTRLSGKTFALAKSELQQSAKNEGADIVAMNATVTFDAGLPTESKQIVDCKVQFDLKGKAPPSVIHVQFTW